MTIPGEVKNIIIKLQENGFEAYAVGGCVRDLLLGREPKDWDVTTNAKPEEIQKIFPDSFYENEFGTVTVKIENKFTPPQSSPLKGEEKGGVRSISEIEITTFRVEAKYTDKRHPDEVKFTSKLEDDLARRDFTINAMALGNVRDDRDVGSDGSANKFNKRSDLTDLTIIDPFNGQKDLEAKIIRAVGNPEDRFDEDALRVLRAVRFAVQLGFEIEEKTARAIKENAKWLRAIAKERIKDEFEKIIMSNRPAEGILMLRDLGLLEYIIPELEKGIGVGQNRHHIFTIFEHNVESIKFAVFNPPTPLSKGGEGGSPFSNEGRQDMNSAPLAKGGSGGLNIEKYKSVLVVRLAALLHDIAKPQAKRGEGPDSTFYNHDILGARTAAKILDRLRFPNEIVERVANLIRNHMFVYDIGAVTEAGVRRLLRRVGPENMEDLIALRVADRLGSGVPKAQPYRLRHFQYMVEKVQHDAISVKMLKINGNDLMDILKIAPGPKIGAILDVLLAEVIEDQLKNIKEYLSNRAKELNEIDLTQLRQMAKERIEEKKEEEDEEIKGRYWVR